VYVRPDGVQFRYLNKAAMDVLKHMMPDAEINMCTVNWDVKVAVAVVRINYNFFS